MKLVDFVGKTISGFRVCPALREEHESITVYFADGSQAVITGEEREDGSRGSVRMALSNDTDSHDVDESDARDASRREYNRVFDEAGKIVKILGEYK